MTTTPKGRKEVEKIIKQQFKNQSLMNTVTAQHASALLQTVNLGQKNGKTIKSFLVIFVLF